MKCSSCKVEVDPKLKFSIAQNMCPACGKKIFSQIEFFLRKSFIDILEKNDVKYPEQVNSIVNDLVNFIDKQAKQARETGALPEIEQEEVIDRNEEIEESLNTGQEEGEIDAREPHEIQATEEEIEFMRENNVMLGDGSMEDGGEAMDAIKRKADKLKKKVRKTNVPKPITLSER